MDKLNNFNLNPFTLSCEPVKQSKGKLRTFAKSSNIKFFSVFPAGSARNIFSGCGYAALGARWLKSILKGTLRPLHFKYIHCPAIEIFAESANGLQPGGFDHTAIQ